MIYFYIEDRKMLGNRETQSFFLNPKSLSDYFRNLKILGNRQGQKISLDSNVHVDYGGYL
jgi:hypothetical protein